MNKHILKPTISADDIIRWYCCYEHSRVRELLPEPQSLTDLLKRADISPQDRVWVATQPGVLSDWTLFNFAANCAERALRAVGVTDTRCWRAVEHARERAHGAKRDSGVGRAAFAAVYAHAAFAVTFAATFAAYIAADDAADTAAHAARAATATQGGSNAERSEQVADLLRLIETGDAASLQPAAKAGGEA